MFVTKVRTKTGAEMGIMVLEERTLKANVDGIFQGEGAVMLNGITYKIGCRLVPKHIAEVEEEAAQQKK